MDDVSSQLVLSRPVSLEPNPSELVVVSDQLGLEVEPRVGELRDQVEDSAASSVETPFFISEEPVAVEHSGEEELEVGEPMETALIIATPADLEDMPTVQVPKADLDALQQADLEDMPTVQVSKTDLEALRQTDLEDMPTVQVPKADLEALQQADLEDMPTALMPKEEGQVAIKPSGRRRPAVNLPVPVKPRITSPVFLDTSLQINRSSRARGAISSHRSTRFAFIIVGIAMLIILVFSGVFGSFILSSINNANLGVQREQEISLTISNYYQSIEQQQYGQASDYIDTQHFLCGGKILPLDQFYAQAQAIDQQQGKIIDASIVDEGILSVDGTQIFRISVTRQESKPYSVQVVVKEVSPNNLLIVSVSSL